MRTRFLRGTTEENNGLILPEGELSIDEEMKAVRLHDGSTPGGFEIIGTQAVMPGETLIAGDATHGFYGQISSANFIDGETLAAAVGLSYGTAINTTTNWLKFSINNKVLYIPQKPIRADVSWIRMYIAGAVYGTGDVGPGYVRSDIIQDARVTIAGQDYIVRLIKGLGDTRDTVPEQLPVDPTHSYYRNSEYEKTLLKVSGYLSQYQTGENWLSLTNEELGLIDNYTNCQEYVQGTEQPAKVVKRGYSTSEDAVDWIGQSSAHYDPSSGWRPVLELVVE